MEKLTSLGMVVGKTNAFADVYASLLSIFPDRSAYVLHPVEGAASAAGFSSGAPALNEVEWMMIDSLDYIPWDISVKVDRAAMSASLETRVLEASWT